MSDSTTADGWCTPLWLAELLGSFQLDPCSNDRSHVNTIEACALESEQDNYDGRNGLVYPWGQVSVFCNPPYSNVMPWAKRLRDHDGPWCALLKLDPSTKWWAVLMEASPTIAPFRKRIKFEGDKAMTANFPSVLVYSAWRPSRELAQHLWLPTYAARAA